MASDDVAVPDEALEHEGVLGPARDRRRSPPATRRAGAGKRESRRAGWRRRSRRPSPRSPGRSPDDDEERAHLVVASRGRTPRAANWRISIGACRVRSSATRSRNGPDRGSPRETGWRPSARADGAGSRRSRIDLAGLPRDSRARPSTVTRTPPALPRRKRETLARLEASGLASPDETDKDGAPVGVELRPRIVVELEQERDERIRLRRGSGGGLLLLDDGRRLARDGDVLQRDRGGARPRAGRAAGRRSGFAISPRTTRTRARCRRSFPPWRAVPARTASADARTLRRELRPRLPPGRRGTR